MKEVEYKGGKEYIKTFRYIGSKYFIIEEIIYHIIRSNKTEFIEPFSGSAVLSINLANYDNLLSKIYFNDLDTRIINIHKIFQTLPFERYNYFINKYVPKYPNLSDKNVYYEFRNMINKFNSNDIRKYLGWFYCFGACINGMIRFGPNGFNQSAANQDLSIRYDYYSYTKLQKLYKRCVIENMDYKLFIEKYINENSILFLDPPYSNMSDTYENNFNEFKKKEFLDYISKIETSVLYTDQFNENEFKYMKSLNNNWKYKIIREMKNISPNINKDDEIYDRGLECLYMNF